MTKTSAKIVFFGNERLATGISTTAPTLRSLIKNGYDVTAVVSNFTAANSRQARELEIADIAKSHNIPLMLPEKLRDIKAQIAGFGASVGILVAYGKMVPQDIFAMFPHGIINIHPSLLPRHRGPTPIESSILQGDQKTGVSIMQLASAMDAGPIFGQSELTLNGTETKQELADKLLDIGQAMIIDLLPGILDDKIAALPQDNASATYDRLIDKADGSIDWHKPAVQLEREIRAFDGWPKSRTTIVGKEVIITKAHVLQVKNNNKKPGNIDLVKDLGELHVACGQDSIVIDRLKPAGKPEMTAQAFIAGYGQTLRL